MFRIFVSSAVMAAISAQLLLQQHQSSTSIIIQPLSANLTVRYKTNHSLFLAYVLMIICRLVCLNFLFCNMSFNHVRQRCLKYYQGFCHKTVFVAFSATFSNTSRQVSETLFMLLYVLMCGRCPK